MGTKKSNLVVLAILLATLPMYVLAGCKKKVQFANANSPETFTKEQQIQLTKFASEEIYQPDQLFTYSLSENDYDEFDEDPDEDEDEEEPGDDSDEPNDEQPDDEEQYPDDEPNEYPDDEPNDSWY